MVLGSYIIFGYDIPQKMIITEPMDLETTDSTKDGTENLKEM